MFIGLSLALTLNTGGGVRYEAEALALFARFTTPPTTARKGHINALVKSLKDAGVWSKLAFLYILAAADAQAARRNWITDLYNATAVSSPSFTADRGYQGDGSSSYLTSGYAPPGQDDNHIGEWSLTNLDGTGIDVGNTKTFIGPRSAGNMTTRNNTGGSASVAVSDSLGHIVNSRGIAASYSRYKGGVSLGNAADVSSAPSTNPVAIGARGTNTNAADSFSARRIAVAHSGTNLTAQNVADMHAALTTYLTAVGAI